MNVYAATVRNHTERGLYVAAPFVGRNQCAGRRCLGVVMFKMPFAPSMPLLARTGLPTLLLSPQGGHIGHLSRVAVCRGAAPLTQSRIDSIARLRQFGRHFDNRVASALPFLPWRPRC